MVGNDTASDTYDIYTEINLGMDMIPPDSFIALGDFYQYAGSVQLAFKKEKTAPTDYWFSLKQTMTAQGKYYLMVSYPPSFYEGADKIPLVLLELKPDKSLHTLSESEAKLLKNIASTIANRNAALDLSPLTAVLGKILDWEEIKHRM